jgi:hypothetical protein
MAMLYPKCPKCGGKCFSLYDHIRIPGGRAIVNGVKGHPVAALIGAAIAGAMAVGEEIYKRVPGGGEKMCEKCGHKFS